ncbi:MAG: hypothetical protein IJR77_03715 [Bacteroidales bacterium]|nr:hypothetical protein [Bacteroidales bacterium]
MTQEELKVIEEMEAFLKQVAPPDDPYVLTDRLSYLNAYMAWAGTLLGKAQEELRNAKKAVQVEHFASLCKMPATVQKDFVENMCAKEIAMVTVLDRLNAACTHQSDNIRTQVSFIKQQMALECGSGPVQNN